MWIAIDKDGFFNGFIIKPRRFKGFFNKEFWTTVPYETLWPHIPYSFINTLPDKIKNLTWEDEPVEVELTVVSTKQ